MAYVFIRGVPKRSCPRCVQIPADRGPVPLAPAIAGALMKRQDEVLGGDHPSVGSVGSRNAVAALAEPTP